MWRRDSNAVCQFVGLDCVKLPLLRNKEDLMHMKVSGPNRKMCLSYKLMLHRASEAELLHIRQKKKKQGSIMALNRAQDVSMIQLRWTTQIVKVHKLSAIEKTLLNRFLCLLRVYKFVLSVWKMRFLLPWDRDINCFAQMDLYTIIHP